MKNNWGKRILAFLLCMSMMFGSSVAALAENEDHSADEEVSESVQTEAENAENMEKDVESEPIELSEEPADVDIIQTEESSLGEISSESIEDENGVLATLEETGAEKDAPEEQTDDEVTNLPPEETLTVDQTEDLLNTSQESEISEEQNTIEATLPVEEENLPEEDKIENLPQENPDISSQEQPKEEDSEVSAGEEETSEDHEAESIPTEEEAENPEEEKVLESEFTVSGNSLLQEYKMVYEDDNILVTVEAKEAGILPEGTSLKVTPIVAEDEKTKEQYQEIEERLYENAEEEAYDLLGFLACDISFVDQDGLVVEPNGEVKVTMEYKEAAIPEEITKEESEEVAVTVLHLEQQEEEESQLIDLSKDNMIENMEMTDNLELQKVEFVTESFSPYLAAWMSFRADNAQLLSDIKNAVYTLSIKDNMMENGHLEAQLQFQDKVLAQRVSAAEGFVHYKWYKKITKGSYDGPYQEVSQIKHGDAYNIADDGYWLNVALDEGALNTNQPKVKYKVAVFFGNEAIASRESEDYSVSYWNEIRNGGFEEPNIDHLSINKDQSPVVSRTVTGSTIYAQVANGYPNLIWKTTGEGKNGPLGNATINQDIELIRITSGSADSVKNAYQWTDSEMKAADGKQLVELNCEADGALYQDILTIPGEKMNYWFSQHIRGGGNGNTSESNKDFVYVVIAPTELAKMGINKDGNPIDKYEEVEQLIEMAGELSGVHVAKYSCENGKWYDHSGSYVPTTYLTRFFLVSAKETADKWEKRNGGNLIDKVGFSQQLPPANPGSFNLQIRKRIEGLSGKECEALMKNLSFTINVNNPNAPLYNKTIYANQIEWKNNADGSYIGIYEGKELAIPGNTAYTYSITENNADVALYSCTSSVNITGGIMQADGKSTSVKERDSITFDFTNTYTPKLRSLQVEKIWKDGDNKYTTRPDQIQVQLLYREKSDEQWMNYPNGQYTLTADGGWITTVADLPVIYEYKVKELSVNAYTTALVSPESIKSDSWTENQAQPTKITLTNTLAPNWKMIKQSSSADQNGSHPALPGAEFVLKQGTSEIASGSSDNNGEITWNFKNTDKTLQSLDGPYIVSETKAPPGYALDTIGWTVTFTEGVLTGFKVGTKEVSIEPDNNKQVTLYLENTPLYTLPSTGSTGILGYLFSGVMLMMVSVLFMYRKKYAGRC